MDACMKIVKVEEQSLQGYGQGILIKIVGNTMKTVLHIQEVSLANLLLIGQQFHHGVGKQSHDAPYEIVVARRADFQERCADIYRRTLEVSRRLDAVQQLIVDDNHAVTCRKRDEPVIVMQLALSLVAIYVGNMLARLLRAKAVQVMFYDNVFVHDDKMLHYSSSVSSNIRIIFGRKL